MSAARDSRDPADSLRRPPTPLTLVTGFLGAGKTTAIRRWLASRPTGERWAVLVNDFGVLAVDAAAYGAPEGIGIFEVAGGCACCAASVAMRTSLGRVMRRGPWDRVVVELSGLGHPAPLIDQLREIGRAMALRIDSVVALVDASRPAPWIDPDARHRELARAQLDVADMVILTRLDGASPDVAGRLVEALADGPFGARPVLPAGPCAPDWSEVAAAIGQSASADARRTAGDASADARPAAHHDHAGRRDAPVQGPAIALPVAVAAGGRRWVTCTADGVGIAWQWPAEVRFDRRALLRWAGRVANDVRLLRAKGAFRTERDWYFWQHTPSGAHWESTGWRRDSRIECLFAADGGPIDAAGLERGLLDALAPAADRPGSG